MKNTKLSSLFISQKQNFFSLFILDKTWKAHLRLSICCFIYTLTSIITYGQVSGLKFYNDAKKAIITGDFKNAIELHQRAIPLLIAEEEFSKSSEALLEISVLLHNYGNIEEAFKNIFQAKHIIEENLGKENALYGICLLNLSAFIYEKRQISTSLELDKTAINILEKVNHDKKQIAILLNNIALTQELIGEFERARKNLKKAISIQVDSLGKFHVNTAKSYYNLGYLHMRENNYTEAVKSLQLSLQILFKVDKEGLIDLSKEFIKTYQRLGRSFQKMNMIDSSRTFIDRALFSQPTDRSYRKYLSLELKADNLLHEKKYPSAILHGLEAIRLVKLEYQDFIKHPVIARQYTHLGEIYQANNQLDSAVHYFHQAFLYLAHDFEDKNVYSIPKVKQCFLEYDIIRSLRGKARAMFLRFEASKDIRDLQTSLDTYELTHEFINKLKEDISTMGSKQKLAGDALEIYEEAIETALTLYEITNDDAFLEKALFYAESNKAILLLESMNERMAQTASGIPDTLLEKEKQFRVDIAYYEREINDEKNQKEVAPDPSKLKKWEDQLYSLQRQYQQLIDQFEEQYPKYYELKYDTKLAGLKNIRRDMIDRKTAFLEYFVGVKNIYIFAITRSDFKVHRLPKPETFEKDLSEIYRLVKKTKLITEEVPRFQEKIYIIYQQYLAEVIDQMPNRINRLLIVPDDLFNLIPFELWSRSPQKSSYLIEDYTIGYTYSASLFQASKKSRESSDEQLFLGFAPAFPAPIAESRNCAGDRLSNLDHSRREVEGIQALLGGDIVLGTEAKRDSFLKQATHYRIIHLATHACMDKDNPMQSKVFFSDDPIVNQELFNLNLAADLAVLSACNTGSGQLVKGDGVLSLSKGFVHAGCPSAVMSLWSVDDFSTSEIMIDFYAYLKRGYSKDQALRAAKLDFLARADKVKRHPFFWAAFVQMGDPVAMNFGETSRSWQALLLGTLLVLVGVYLGWKRIAKRELAST